MDEAGARKLLGQARAAKTRLDRHLLIAAALRQLLETEPIVVGGTAEEFWTRDEYHPTDVDLCAPLSRADLGRLRRLGFRREGRHWFYPDVPSVAIEFPDDSIDGSFERTYLEPVGDGAARIIGLDDLYLDRLRQASANPVETSKEFMSALAVMAARYEDLDRRYIRSRLAAMEGRERDTVAEMRRIDSRLQRRVRRMLTER